MTVTLFPNRMSARPTLLLLLSLGTMLAIAIADRCDVRDFGAIGDGVSLATLSIRRAIAARRCTTVLLPSPGRYLSGTIRLKSNMVQCGPNCSPLCCPYDVTCVPRPPDHSTAL